MSANDDHDIMYVTWQESSSEESSSNGSDEPEGRKTEDGYVSPAEPVLFLNGNNNIPILNTGKQAWTKQQIADLISNKKSKPIATSGR